ncbi:MAG: DUF2270 domain-containing protein [Verrucomicrobiota bacterium]|jgi:uncharacterized membrane protein|nr:DUF2270 domain-containing protein [Verrucomicrobiota bacterium]
MNDPPQTAVPFDANAINALSHFYRGEVNRIMIWRQRMDVTTNWAVGVTTALLTSGYAMADGNHFVFVLAFFMLSLLLAIEGRRFRHYHAYLFRVRMLEQHFIGSILDGRPLVGVHPGWCRELKKNLDHPVFKISKGHAILSRFRKTYYWLYFLLVLLWLVKVLQDTPVLTLRTVVDTFFAGLPFSHPVTCLVMASIMGFTLWLIVGGFFLIPYSEECETPKIYPRSHLHGDEYTL